MRRMKITLVSLIVLSIVFSPSVYAERRFVVTSKYNSDLEIVVSEINGTRGPIEFQLCEKNKCKTIAIAERNTILSELTSFQNRAADFTQPVSFIGAFFVALFFFVIAPEISTKGGAKVIATITGILGAWGIFIVADRSQKREQEAKEQKKMLQQMLDPNRGFHDFETYSVAYAAKTIQNVFGDGKGDDTYRRYWQIEFNGKTRNEAIRESWAEATTWIRNSCKKLLGKQI